MSCGDPMRSLLLAGGRSRRMGRDKALVEIDGQSCIARVASALAEAGLETIRIAVSSPEDIEHYGETLPDGLDVEWVLDASPHAGPIEALIEAIEDPMNQDLETLQLAPVDVPWVTAGMFSALSGALAEEDALAVPTDGERMHPLLALIRPSVVGQAINQDRRPLHVQFTQMQHSLLLEDRAILRNLNKPADLD